ncbi:Dysferlin, limb girdle muscular dystrophy 2B (Autosomal recessive), partial [Cichlidogyrus casuarinus]
PQNLIDILGYNNQGSDNEEKASTIFSAPDARDPRLRPMIEANMVGAEMFHVSLTIWRGMHLTGTNINPVIHITCGEFLKKTTVKLSTNSPYYSESFKFPFVMTRSSMMDTTIKLQCFNANTNPIMRLLPGKLIGEFTIDCRTIYECREHSIIRKWALLINPKDPLSGSKGYLKISLSCAAQGELVQRDDGNRIENEDNIEANLITPSRYLEMTKRVMTDLRVILYRAEDLPPMNTKAMAKVKRTFLGQNTEMCDPYVEVSFGGFFNKTKVKNFTYNPDWNQEIVFSDFFPPLTTTIRITVKDWDAIKDEVISTFLIDLRDIMRDGSNSGFLPTFGPSWVNLYGTPRDYVIKEQEQTGKELNIGSGEGVAYRGRLLMAIKTKSNPDIEKSTCCVRPCVQVGDNVCGRKHQFLLFCSIFEAAVISTEIGSKAKDIRFEMSIGIFGNKLDLETGGVSDVTPARLKNPKGNRQQVDWYHSLSVPTKPETKENIYYYLNFENKKPCMYQLCEFEDQRVRMCIPNILEKMKDKFLDNLLKIRYLAEKNDLGRARHKLRSSLRKLEISIDQVSKEVKNCRGTAPQSLMDKQYKQEVRRSLEKIKEMIKNVTSKHISKTNLSAKLREANTIVKILCDAIRCPQHPLPDVFIYMIVENKRVAYCRIPSRDVYHSANKMERGKWSSQIGTFHLKKPGLLGMGEGSYSIQCQLKMYIWLGLVKDYMAYLKGLPDGYDKNSIPPSDPPREIVYVEQSVFQFRAYIFSAKHLLPSDETGLSDPLVRVLFGNTVLQSQTIYETCSPLWDITLINYNIVFHFDASSVKKQLQEVVLEVFDLDSKNPEKSLHDEYATDEMEFLGRALCQPNVYVDGDSYTPPKLRWWPVFRSNIKGGQILAAFDLIQKNPQRPFVGVPDNEEMEDFTKRFNEHVVLSNVSGIMLSDDEDEIIFSSDEDNDMIRSDNEPDQREVTQFEEDLSDNFDPDREARSLIAASERSLTSSTQLRSGRARRKRVRNEKITVGMAPPELIRWRKEDQLRIPLSIRPHLCKFRLEVMFWGMRELKNILILPVDKPKIIMDIGGTKIYSDIIENASKDSMFKDRLKYIDLYLPEDHRLWPPISMVCIENRVFGQKYTLGSAMVPELTDFASIPQAFGDYYSSTHESEEENEAKPQTSKTASTIDLARSEAVLSAHGKKDEYSNVNEGFDQENESGLDIHSQVPLVAGSQDVDLAVTTVLAGLVKDDIKKTDEGLALKKIWTQSSLPKDEFSECDWWSRFYATLSSLTQEIQDDCDKDVLTDSEDSEYEDELRGVSVQIDSADDGEVIDIPEGDATKAKKRKWQFWKREPKKKLTALERREKAKRKRRKRRARTRQLKRVIGFKDSKKKFEAEMKIDDLKYDNQLTAVDDSWIEKITIYSSCLEEVKELGGFTDPLRTFKIYNGKMSDDEITPERRYVGSFKGNLVLYPIDDTQPPVEKNELRLFKTLPVKVQHKITVYIYIIRALELQPMDSSGLSDPYLILQLGDKVFNERESYKPNELNPVFGSTFVVDCELPKQSFLYLKVCDRALIGPDSLIGETKIDLESRYLSPRRAGVGLMPTYYTQGYCKWKDQHLPTEILESMCEKYQLDQPCYNSLLNEVTIDGQKFSADTDIMSETGDIFKSNEPLALEALKNFHQLTDEVGPLVPEHVETRALTNLDYPGLEMGRVQMWVDIYDKELQKDPPEPTNIAPRIPKEYELRIIIHNTANVVLTDGGMFSGEKSSDIYVKGWVKGVGIDDQKTDVHYKSLTGHGMFNWRFLFRFDYLTHENAIRYPVKKTFALDPVMIKSPCQLVLQVYDANLISSDKFLGEIVIPLAKIPRGATSPNACGLHQLEETCPTISLFRQRHLRGWWPVTIFDEDLDETLVQGKVEVEFRLLTSDDADSNPVGLGREEPEPLEPPKRPDSSFMNFLGPLGMLGYFIKYKLKWILIKILIISLILLVVILFLYSAPTFGMQRIINMGPK